MTTERELDRLLAPWLDSVRSPQPDGLLETVLTATGSTRPRPAWRVRLSRNPMFDAPSGANWMAPMALAATALVVAILVSIGLLARSPNVGPPPAPSPTDTARAQIEWAGPVRATVGAPLLQSMAGAASRAEGPSGPIPLFGWDEGSPDAPVPWVDITGVRFTPGALLTWYVDIGAYPPRTDSLDRDETLISYGLVVDANEDGVADYELGMSNDAPTPGDLRLWITNFATGETDEHIGRPNGQPFEEWHPDSRISELGEGRQPRFTLPESDLAGVDSETVRFYAWSSVTEGPDVVAWDYAPDEGWLTLAAGSTDRTHPPRRRPHSQPWGSQERARMRPASTVGLAPSEPAPGCTASRRIQVRLMSSNRHSSPSRSQMTASLTAPMLCRSR